MGIGEILAGVSVENEVSFDNLQVFPLLLHDDQVPPYVLFDDLLEQEKVEITELDEGGHVPTIKVCNRSDFDALIVDGTELHGAKQDRMVDITLIIPKKTEVPIPVSCVEQGRWSYRSKGFSSSSRTVASRLRSSKAWMVAESLKSGGTAQADQSAVWKEVDGYIARSKASSPTSAMQDVFNTHEEETKRIRGALKEVKANGAVVALNGHVVALDLVASRKVFQKLWDTLLRGYALDAALERSSGFKPITKSEIESSLRLAVEASVEKHDVPGSGDYYSVTAKDMAGGLVTLGDKLVHLMLFPEAPASP